MSALRRLLRGIARYPGPLAIGLAMVCLSTGGVLLEPRILGYAIDEGIVPHDWPRLRWLAVAYGLVTAARALGVIGQGYFFEKLGQRVTLELRASLFSHLQAQPMSVFDKNPAGRLLTRVTNDVASINEMFTAGFVALATNVAMVLGILIWIIALDPKLGLIAAAVVPALALASVKFSVMLRDSYREARTRLSALNSFLAENLQGVRVIQLFNRGAIHLERFARLNVRYADAQISSVRVFAMFQPTITVSAGAALALVIAFGGPQVLSGQLKLGVWVAFFAYVLSLFQPMREIADKWNVFLSGMASAERIYSILDWPAEMPPAQGPARRIEGARGRVEFENVWFAYEGAAGAERWVLRDFSLVIPAGSTIGVVGHTGAGKTTLISLLMRFYEPQRGRILLDGRDIREIDKRALRATLGLVQQDVFLFAASARENVTFWGAAPVPPSELAPLGEGRSGGQRQLLSFARALAADPSVWVLDEATANMDSGSELEVRRALEIAARGRTAILIAHRLATVRTADRIVVLNHGQLVEQGTHDELLRLGGLYFRLYEFQKIETVANLSSEVSQHATD